MEAIDQMTGFDLKPLEYIGQEVVGLDLTGPLEPETATALYAAWLEHGVLLFREAGISDEVHLRLSRLFGTLEEYSVKEILVEDNPDLIFLGGESQKGTPKIVDGEKRAGFIFYHHDTNYTPYVPKGAVMRMAIIPERGGDTIWTDTRRAYEALPQHLKSRVEGLSAVVSSSAGIPHRRLWGWPGHTAVYGEAPADAVEFNPGAPRVEPLVTVHPETGAKALMIDPLDFVKIIGMDQAEGDDLFDEIAQHALRPEFSYRHHWAVNDMVAWDNRRTMHCALGYPYDQSRLAFRTTLAGGMPVGSWYDGA